MNDPARAVDPTMTFVDRVMTILGGDAILTGPTLRRTSLWWDTPDWRLHRARVALATMPASPRATPARAVLVTDDGPPLIADLDGPARTLTSSRAPVTAAALPAGELAEIVTRLAGPRALLPLLGLAHVVTGARALDAIGKTVARLRIVEPAASPTLASGARYAFGGVGDARPASDEQDEPGHVEVEALRGYVRQAAVVARRLEAAGVPVVTVLPAAPLSAGRDGVTWRPADVTRALRAAGFTPGRRLPRREALRALSSAGPSSALPTRVAVATMLRSFLDDIDACAPGVIDDVDAEFLRDLRIAVRRSRSALKFAGDALPAGLVAEFAPRLAWLGRITTPLRDLDVHLAGLPATAARLHAFTGADLDPFAAFLARRRVAEHRALVRTMRSPAWRALCEEWRAALDALLAPDSPDSPDSPDAPATSASASSPADLAAARIARADTRVVRLGSTITDASPADDLHTLRKRVKELRYVLELFAPFTDPALTKALVKDIKGLQDVLGVFQDSEVQRDAIVALAAQLQALPGTAPSSSARAGKPTTSAGAGVPVETLLALGEIAGHLAAEQARARAAFAGRFADYLGPTPRAHVAALTGRSRRTSRTASKGARA